MDAMRRSRTASIRNAGVDLKPSAQDARSTPRPAESGLLKLSGEHLVSASVGELLHSRQVDRVGGHLPDHLSRRIPDWPLENSHTGLERSGLEKRRANSIAASPAVNHSLHRTIVRRVDY
jgi:hypothetical protein